MKWVMLTRNDGDAVWFNLEKFEMVHETVDDDGHACTALVVIISENEFCEIFVREKPEDFLFLPVENFEKKRTEIKQNVKEL
jgi:hypothetical protein